MASIAFRSVKVELLIIVDFAHEMALGKVRWMLANGFECFVIIDSALLTSGIVGC